MKAPVRLSQPENINPYADRELLSGSHRYSKPISIKINVDLYAKLLAESDKKLIVMAELIREAINHLLNNPNQSYDARLVTNNVKGISFVIDLTTAKKMEDFKSEYGINKSNQIRQALSARYVKK